MAAALTAEPATQQRGGLRRVLVTLSVTETTSWGILYYAFPVLAGRISADTGWSLTRLTAAFSLGLVVSAVLGIAVGRWLDRQRPRWLMTAGSVLAVVAVVGVALAPTFGWFVTAWAVAGVAMSAVLYPPAFAALTRWYGDRRVHALTVLTLAAGLASTIFAPITAGLASQLDWRTTYLVLAGLLGVVTVPAHLLGLRLPWPPLPARSGSVVHAPRRVLRSRAFVTLVVSFGLTSLTSYVVVVNLVPLLGERGFGPWTAAVVLGIGGVGQVLGRLGYAPLARRLGVRARTLVVLATVAVTTGLLGVLSWLPALVAVAVLAGMVRGIVTLLQATAVTDRWDARDYGTLSGVLAAPLTFTTAVAPFLGAALAVLLGSYAAMLMAMAVVGLAAAALSLGSLPRSQEQPAPGTGSVTDIKPSPPVHQVDVLVVGGGQAALAAGYYLQRARRRGATDLTFALLDDGPSAGGAWTGGWDTLQLFSPASFSSLPGWQMPVWTGQGNPTAEHVRRYLAAYEDRYRLPVHRPVHAHTVTRTAGGGFEVVTGVGVWRCRVLVNATGAWGRPFWPTYPGMAGFRGRQLRTVDYRRAADFEGQTVLVVGGGNSGAQITADLTSRRHGGTVWVTARPPRFLPDDVDGRRLFELATRRVRAAAAGEPTEQGVGGLGDIVMVPPVLTARRRGDLQAQPMFDRLTPTGVAWDDPPRHLAVDTIVWCTGFRANLRHLTRLSMTRRDGLPVTDPVLPSRSVDDPALFFLGYGDWCGPASATLIGVGAAARAAVDAALTLLQPAKPEMAPQSGAGHPARRQPDPLHLR